MAATETEFMLPGAESGYVTIGEVDEKRMGEMLDMYVETFEQAIEEGHLVMGTVRDELTALCAEAFAHGRYRFAPVDR